MPAADAAVATASSLAGLLTEGEAARPARPLLALPALQQPGRPARRRGPRRRLEARSRTTRPAGASCSTWDATCGESTNLAEQQPGEGRRAGREAGGLAEGRRRPDADAQPRLRARTPRPPTARSRCRPATAEVHGVMLRYEPLPHKNTLGFWTRADDWASWEFDVTKPGHVRGRGPGRLRQGERREHGRVPRRATRCFNSPSPRPAASSRSSNVTSAGSRSTTPAAIASKSGRPPSRGPPSWTCARFD